MHGTPESAYGSLPDLEPAMAVVPDLLNSDSPWTLSMHVHFVLNALFVIIIFA